ncbi:MAG: protein translocase subunit SecDF, partial [Bacteroidaceae bacterium]|nr:protein translocase subunit SecDF [Bacteroidaceae bacterium]
MQNKGFVKAFALLLTLVCAFYLSFSVVTNHYDNKYQEMIQTEGKEAADRYMDSLNTHDVYLWSWNLKECREMGIGLGLDLKGGMNVILEVSVPDVIKALADHKEENDETFRQAVELSAKQATESQSDFITLFVKNFKEMAPERTLAELFATQQLRDKVSPKSTDKEVENVLRAELKSAIDNSYNVLRTRIDRFGVVQPNIQALEGQEGRIMVEMPGVKEPERVRKLLQGSANLEFWETYNSQEITPFLAQLDSKLAATLSAEATEAETEGNVAETADSTANKSDLASAIANNASDKSQASEAEIERFKKQHPLLSKLQLTQGAYGCVVGFAHKRDMDAISELLATP